MAPKCGPQKDSIKQECLQVIEQALCQALQSLPVAGAALVPVAVLAEQCRWCSDSGISGFSKCAWRRT